MTTAVPESASIVKVIRKRATPGWIGIDVGSAWVKVAQVESTGARLRLRAAAAIPVHDVSVDGDLNWGLLATAIRNLRDDTTLRGRNTACVLTNQSYQCERLDFDGDPTEQREEILRVISKRMSRPESDIAVDFWTLPDRRRQSAVQTVAMKKRTGDELGRALNKAGLSISCLDSPMTVAARCAALQMSGRTPRNVAVINWGQSMATLTAVNDGVPCFHRGFRNCGLANGIQALANHLSISTADATVLLQRYGLPQSTQTTAQMRIATTIFGALRGPLRDFRNELERTLAYIGRKLGLGQPEGILLTGGGGCIPGLDAWLADDTGYPTECWSPDRTVLSCPLSRETSLPLFAQAVALSALQFEGDIA